MNSCQTSRLLRLGAAALGGAVLLGYVALAARTYRSRTAPESALGPGAALVGPSGHALEDAADRRIEWGLAELSDPAWPAAERFEIFIAELRVAEKLLVGSLRAQPSSATALAKLAAVRFELEPPLSDEATREHLELIRLSARMAPASPRVHLRLAELLLKMGRGAEAAPYLARAVELDPSQAPPAVRLLAERGAAAQEIAGALPRHPRVLVALERPFTVQRRLPEYVALVEEWLSEPGAGLTPALLASYGNGCLALGQPDRLRQRLDGIGVLSDPRLEAERLRQRSRAWLAAGDPARALDDARGACASAPDSAVYTEYRGDVALAQGEATEAVAAFQEALGQTARGGGAPHLRARLYRKIGQAEERRANGDRAYDAYRMALRLDPAEAYARRRVEETERAAGKRTD